MITKTSETTVSQDAVSAWIALARAGTAITDRIEHDLTAAGLPPLSWYDVLLELERAADGELRQRDIARRMLLARYNVSRLADRLESAGLVERVTLSGDRRGGVLRITDEGRAVRKRVWPVYAAAIARNVGDRLDAGEAAELARLLRKLTG